jgi:NAD+ synthase
MPLAEIIARGHAPETVKKVERLLYIAEYKRRQAAPGVKISSRNFGRDRRYPITNRFREAIVAPPEQATRAPPPAPKTTPSAQGEGGGRRAMS